MKVLEVFRNNQPSKFSILGFTLVGTAIVWKFREVVFPPIELKPANEIQSLIKEADLPRPQQLVFEKPKKILAGDCTAIGLQMKDASGNTLAEASGRLVLKDASGAKMNIYSGPKCALEDFPTPDFPLGALRKKGVIYTQGTKVGSITVSATDLDQKPISIANGDFPPVEANPTKIAVQFNKSPSSIGEFIPFDLELSVTDTMGNPIEVKDVLKLYYQSATEEPQLLGDIPITGSKAVLKKYFFPEIKADALSLKAVVGGASVTSPTIRKIPFRERTIIVKWIGKEQFAGIIKKPGEVEVLGKNWKPVRKNSHYETVVSGKNYWLEAQSEQELVLKPL